MPVRNEVRLTNRTSEASCLVVHVYGQGWSVSGNTLFSVFAFFIGEEVRLLKETRTKLGYSMSAGFSSRLGLSRVGLVDAFVYRISL